MKGTQRGTQLTWLERKERDQKFLHVHGIIKAELVLFHQNLVDTPEAEVLDVAQFSAAVEILAAVRAGQRKVPGHGTQQLNHKCQMI